LRDLAELCPASLIHCNGCTAYNRGRRGETLSPPKWRPRRSARFEAIRSRRRDLIEANRNYFPDGKLGQAADKSARELNVPSEQLFAALGTRLRERHSAIVTRIMRSMSCARRCGASIRHRRIG